MSLINCKVELKNKETNDCVFLAADADNPSSNSNNITFSNKGTKLYVPVVTLSAKTAKKYQNFVGLKKVSKGFERSVYWNNFKTKSKNKNKTNEYRYFLESNFVGVNILFHCVKVVQIRSFSCPYFPAFGLNVDQRNSAFGHFSPSVCISLFKSRWPCWMVQTQKILLTKCIIKNYNTLINWKNFYNYQNDTYIKQYKK